MTTHIHEIVKRLWPRTLTLSQFESQPESGKAEEQGRAGLECVDIGNPGLGGMSMELEQNEREPSEKKSRARNR